MNGKAGMSRALTRQVAGYVTVGVINTVVTSCLYLELYLFMPYWLASTICFAASVAIALFGNARWVFAGAARPASALQFALFYVLNYVASLAMVVTLVERFLVSPILGAAGRGRHYASDQERAAAAMSELAS
jgi:putative flippase GtrA